ncbi:hypothetical protein ACU4GG_07035 [Streptomyces nojiriensis]
MHGRAVADRIPARPDGDEHGGPAGGRDAGRPLSRGRRGRRRVRHRAELQAGGLPPHIVVRTRDADSGHALFKEQAASITSFLTREEGLSLDGGYTMDVYGPDGRLLHRWDATI